MLLDCDDLLEFLKNHLKIHIDSKTSHPLYGEGAPSEIVVSLELNGEIISESSLTVGYENY
jgi:hypothetical protein